MEAQKVQIIELHILQIQKIKVLILINHHFLKLRKIRMVNRHKITKDKLETNQMFFNRLLIKIEAFLNALERVKIYL